MQYNEIIDASWTYILVSQRGNIVVDLLNREIVCGLHFHRLPSLLRPLPCLRADEQGQSPAMLKRS